MTSNAAHNQNHTSSFFTPLYFTRFSYFFSQCEKKFLCDSTFHLLLFLILFKLCFDPRTADRPTEAVSDKTDNCKLSPTPTTHCLHNILRNNTWDMWWNNIQVLSCRGTWVFCGGKCVCLDILTLDIIEYQFTGKCFEIDFKSVSCEAAVSAKLLPRGDNLFRAGQRSRAHVSHT